MTEPQGVDMPNDLTTAERTMWTSFEYGMACDLRDGNPLLNDPFSDLEWGPGRSVRADVIALLLLSGPPARPGRVCALKLLGAYVTGKLTLAGGSIGPYVELTGCRFESELTLPESRFTTLRLVGCAIPRLEAARLHTEGDLHLPRCRAAASSTGYGSRTPR